MGSEARSRTYPTEVLHHAIQDRESAYFLEINRIFLLIWSDEVPQFYDDDEALSYDASTWSSYGDFEILAGLFCI